MVRYRYLESRPMNSIRRQSALLVGERGGRGGGAEEGLDNEPDQLGRRRRVFGYSKLRGLTRH